MGRYSLLAAVLFVTAIATGCSCNPIGRWAQEEVDRSDEAMAHTLAIAGDSVGRALSLDGWRAAIAPALRQTARDIERDTAYTKRTAGEITSYVAGETARIVPYTADGIDKTAKYVGSEVECLHCWFCCTP